MKCQRCGKEEALPFKCQFCGGLFCAEHRLPENHDCANIKDAKMPREHPAAYEYKVTFQQAKPTVRFRFSRKEIGHLVIGAVLVLGVGFSIMYNYLAQFGLSLFDLGPGTLAFLFVSFVGLFLLHEIAHKLVAQHYGLWAEFRLIMFGTVLTLISAIPISPFRVIAPGAMMIGGSADQKIIGKTAVAGPLTNIILALLFLPIAYFFPFLFPIPIIIVTFNAWIALFNTLPVLMLDGLKIFKWNKIVWTLVFAVSVVLTIYSSLQIIS